MKKKLGIIAGIVLCLVVVGGGIWWVVRSKMSTDNDLTSVYMNQISDLMGLNTGSMGLQNRYNGLVEPQKTEKVQADSNRVVVEIYVDVDDDVAEGDPLFRYGTDDLTLQLQQQQLELERLNNSITVKTQQIVDLQKQAQNVTGDVLLEYTIQIQEAQANLKQTEYDIESKQLAINKTTEQINNSIVTAPIGGTVRSINKPGSDTQQNYYDGGSGNDAFITIVANGDYRIKGVINEQNAAQITVGSSVTVRSRTDEAKTWTGTITEIDTKNPESGNNNNGYYDGGSSDNMTTSSKYPFYVTLDSYDGLMNGQHVYIEMGEVVSMTPAHTEGVWLYEGYFIQTQEAVQNAMGQTDPEAEIGPEATQIVGGDNSGNSDSVSMSMLTEEPMMPEMPAMSGGNLTEADVYVAGKDGRVEKRHIKLGQYDPNTMEYEVTEGLTREDMIAWPDESVQVGAPVAIQ